MARKVTRLGALVVAFGFAFGSIASAQPKDAASKDKDPKAEALDLFNQSAELYREGKFDEAAKLLERAYSLHPEPVLLYNLGRAYEGLGENEKALDAYTRYVAQAPDAKDRGAVERRIETLKKQLERDKKLTASQTEPKPVEPTVPPEPTPAPVPDSGGGPGVWPWVVTGVGAATIGAGLFVGLQARSKRNDAQDNPVNRDAQAEFENAESMAKTANTLLIVGALITAGGVTWALVGGKKKKPESATLHLTVTPNSLRLGGRL